MLHDAFICHASEDKGDFVRPLAEALRAHHVEVWYDEFTLSVGDGLRRAIDKGLVNSRFGIVVLSPSFFAKRWPQRELDGLVARELDEDRRLILPIWHNISRAEILRESPPLADVLAISSDRGLTEVCNALLRKIRPDESPLIVARDELIYWGVQPPVITDEWWLDVVEASNRVPAFGASVPKNSAWGMWSFPLPNEGDVGELRGARLAWTAMQMAWTEYAERNSICNITNPELVHAFIRNFPGLREVCYDRPHILAHYAPQLMVRQFSGEFSNVFDEMLETSQRSLEARRDTPYACALTSDREVPLCDKEVALRHPTFGNYRSRSISHFYRLGEMWGPSYNFQDFELLVWFLSHGSDWFPQRERDFVTDGFMETALCQYEPDALHDRLWRSRSAATFRWTRTLKACFEESIALSLRKLGVEDATTRVAAVLLERGLIERHFKYKEEVAEARRER